MFIKNMKKVLVICSIFISILFIKVSVHAGDFDLHSWDMRDAEIIPFGQATSGIYDPNSVYYFQVPTRLNVKVTVRYSGNRNQQFKIFDGNGKWLGETWSHWQDSHGTYNKITDTTVYYISRTLNKGGCYILIGYGEEGVKYSITISGTMTQKPSLAKIKNVKKKSSKIIWTKISGATGYEIYRSNSSKGSYKKIKTFSKSVSSFKNTGLKKSKKYYYKVRAFTKVNGQKYYSAFSGKRSVTIKQ